MHDEGIQQSSMPIALKATPVLMHSADVYLKADKLYNYYTQLQLGYFHSLSRQQNPIHSISVCVHVHMYVCMYVHTYAGFDRSAGCVGEVE